MRDILIEKVTVNIGVGAPGDRLENAKGLISRLTGGRKPVDALSFSPSSCICRTVRERCAARTCAPSIAFCSRLQ